MKFPTTTLSFFFMFHMMASHGPTATVLLEKCFLKKKEKKVSVCVYSVTRWEEGYVRWGGDGQAPGWMGS